MASSEKYGEIMIIVFARPSSMDWRDPKHPRAGQTYVRIATELSGYLLSLQADTEADRGLLARLWRASDARELLLPRGTQIRSLVQFATYSSLYVVAPIDRTRANDERLLRQAAQHVLNQINMKLPQQRYG